MKIFLGADHGGFEMKEEIKEWLLSEGHQVEDCGNQVFDPNDDYPQFAFSVGEQVVREEGTIGILLCRSGGGVTISSNKVRGIRAVDVFDLKSAVHAKTHNNANVISLGGDWLKIEEMKEIINEFIKVPFQNEERHVRRIKKIAEYEERGGRK